jgi:hypothetical protein
VHNIDNGYWIKDVRCAIWDKGSGTAKKITKLVGTAGFEPATTTPPV